MGMKKDKVHIITPANITFEEIEQILEKNFTLELSHESVGLIQKSKEYLDRKIRESEGPMYGITTANGV